MEAVKFKTNIKCNACVDKVTPFLDETIGKGNWEVDLQNPNRILTVTSEEADKVPQALQKAGYKGEQLN
jgi:copper chaperone